MSKTSETVVFIFRSFFFKNSNSVVNYPGADLADDRFQSFWTRLLLDQAAFGPGCLKICLKLAAKLNAAKLVAAVMLRIAPAFNHRLTNSGKSSVKRLLYHKQIRFPTIASLIHWEFYVRTGVRESVFSLPSRMVRNCHPMTSIPRCSFSFQD